MHIELQYRNGRYQGMGVDLQRFGLGMLYDDNSNMVLSEWYEDKINGNTFILLGRDGLRSFGRWNFGKMDGVNTVEYGQLSMIAIYRQGITSKTLLVVDKANSLIYIIQKKSRFSDQYTVLNRIDFSSSRVVDLSRLLGLQHQFEITNSKEFLQKIIPQISAGTSIVFLKQQDAYFLGHFKKEKKSGLGILFDSEMNMKAMGAFNDQLNGICSVWRKQGVTQGILSQKIMQITQPTNKKQIFSLLHLKSINYTNKIVYFREIHKLKTQFTAVLRSFIQFQRSFIHNDNDDSLNQYADPQKDKQVAEEVESSDTESMKYSSKYDINGTFGGEPIPSNQPTHTTQLDAAPKMTEQKEFSKINPPAENSRTPGFIKKFKKIQRNELIQSPQKQKDMWFENFNLQVEQTKRQLHEYLKKYEYKAPSVRTVKKSPTKDSNRKGNKLTPPKKWRI